MTDGAAKSPFAKSGATGAPEGAHATMKIMLADDEPRMHTLVARIANDAGYDFVGAEDGARALDVYEREKPDLLNGSRRARIAAGAGVSVTEVNQLMKKFNETKKMMKRMMPAVEEMGGKGKRGKKGKRRRGIPGMGGMKMSDLKKIQDMMGDIK